MMTDGSAEVGRDDGEISPLGKETLKNFYLSFKYSQGSTELQDLLLLYIAKGHSQEEIAEIIKQESALLEGTEKMRPPKEHSIFYTKADPHPFGTFRDIFNGYFILLSEIATGNPRQTPSHGGDVDMRSFYQAEEKSLEGEIAIRMARKDLHYLTDNERNRVKGRPQRESAGSDPYESFVKTYAIDMKPSGSAVYDTLFQKIRPLILQSRTVEPIPTEEIKQNRPHVPLENQVLTNVLAERIQKVESLWEEMHPGQQFFPIDSEISNS